MFASYNSPSLEDPELFPRCSRVIKTVTSGPPNLGSALFLFWGDLHSWFTRGDILLEPELSVCFCRMKFLERDSFSATQIKHKDQERVVVLKVASSTRLRFYRTQILGFGADLAKHTVPWWNEQGWNALVNKFAAVTELQIWRVHPATKTDRRRSITVLLKIPSHSDS